MHRWLLGICVMSLAFGWMVLSGIVHIAAEAMKVVAYGAFGLAAILFLLGVLAYNKVKGSLAT